MEQNYNQNNQKNKKTLILSLVAILVLIGSVVGVAYAMFTFTATGTQENVIKTGYVTINFANVTTIDLTNALPIEDGSVQEVTSGTGLINTMLFDVTSTMNGSMTLLYDIGIDPDSLTSNTGTLTTSNIKIKLQKSTDGTNYSYVSGYGSESTGILMSSIASTAGPKGILTTYGLDGGTFTSSGTVKYKLTAWIDKDWTLPAADAASSICVSATTGEIQTSLTTSDACTAVTEAENEWKVTTTASCSVVGNTTEADCTAASGTWTAAVSQCVNRRTGAVATNETTEAACGTAKVAANSWITPTGTCSDTTYGTYTSCYAHNGSWTQTQGTKSQSFSFKVKVSAKQSTVS